MAIKGQPFPSIKGIPFPQKGISGQGIIGKVPRSAERPTVGQVEDQERREGIYRNRRKSTGLRVRLAPIRGETPKDVLGRTIWLPVILDEYTEEEEGAHTDYDTVGRGEFSQPLFNDGRSNRKLRSTDLEVMTLDWHAPWMHEREDGPDVVKRVLQRISRGRVPVEMVATLRQRHWSTEETRMPITIRSLTRRLKPGEADTRYWSIGIKEWRENETERRAVKGGGGLKRNGPDKPIYKNYDLPLTHKLTATDTLEGLAKKYTGKPGSWRLIADANHVTNFGQKTALVKMKRFKVGDGIKIPDMKPFRSSG